MQFNKVTVIAENVPLGLRNITINYSGVTLTEFTPAKNNTFYYLNIEISNQALAGAIPITFHFANNKTSSSVFYLYERTDHLNTPALTAEDVIYQIIPDRFSDGNPENNHIKHYFEKPDRLNPAGIHGGDIEGITNHLTYISNLGCTSIELLPVLESNLMTHSYDKMATTNFYKIDERLGDLPEYINLIEECQNLNLTFIQSFVLHQIGKHHPWYKKMIDTDFFYQSLFNYDDDAINLNTLLDPYSTEKVKATNRRIWENSDWPTLNQNNTMIQQLLIQHCIWWMETSGTRIIKIEQAARNTPSFLSTLTQKLKEEYPDIRLILDNKSIHNPYSQWKMQLSEDSIYYTDYSFPKLLSNAFSTYHETNEGVNDLYQHAIKQDVKADIQSKIICLDNHILTRAYTNADSESSQLLMMVGYLLTSPGIPSISYGTEWQLKGNYNKGASAVRNDFPGGWLGDSQNGFTQANMSNDKTNFYRQFSAILKWRKENGEILKGDFVHFYPKDDIYAFARINHENSVLIIINNSEQNSHNLVADNYEDILSNYTRGIDIVTGDRYVDYNEIITPAKSITIIELIK